MKDIVFTSAKELVENIKSKKHLSLRLFLPF